ncbi:MAG: SUMF1/EgtB/PvdO family nonheme iron enzyme [Planctomycetia bacterium]|nr:SUMF1/EgtB/PvdO family nonheme iron enzyme [Planctomycetia bacterium]
MTASRRQRLAWGFVGFGGVLAAGGWLVNAFLSWIGLSIVAACGAWQAISFVRRRRAKKSPSAAAEATPVEAPAQPPSNDTESLVEQMLTEHRYALLLRPQVVANLTPDQRRRALESLNDAMAMVPEGDVTLGLADVEEESPDDEPHVIREGTVIRVPGFLLDRYPVTNRQYHKFVTGGGYEQMAIWDQHIWPAVLEFVDATGCPGPRFWKNGRYDEQRADHPVVGVSWYEAAAYARWVGKRLPSDPEWVKAGAWPVPISATSRIQRKYPWGNAMDRARCNLWGSGPGKTVPVTSYVEGVSIGGVHQLIGNVWEWTTSSFGGGTWHGQDLSLPMPMKSLRGGAFDTYFESQACCQFQSGDTPVARKHNVGFRCAVSARDLASTLTEAPGDEGHELGEPNSLVEEEVHA